MLSSYLPGSSKGLQRIGFMVVVLIVAVIGTYLLTSSRAQTPYATVAATSGTRANGAVAQACNGSIATTGECVVFNGTGSSGGGGGGTGSGNTLCGFKSGAPAVSKVMVIWEENESDSAIIGDSSVPYMNQIATSCGYANNYYAYTHPSLPNYMTMTSGVSYATSPWNGDCIPLQSGCTTGNASIFAQLGSNWKSYVESMPSNCDKNNGGATDPQGSPLYAAKHNPAAYYTNIASACAAQDVPLGTTTSGALLSDIQSGLPAFTTVTPNLENDWHDGSAQQADNWLKSWLPIIVAGQDYQSGKLAVLVIFDEGAGGGNTPSKTYATWMSAGTTPGTSSTTSFDNYAVAKTIEDLLGLPELGTAKTANSMSSAFNL